MKTHHLQANHRLSRKKSLIISLEGNNGLRFQHTLCQALMWKLQTHACPQDGEKELYKLSGTAHFVYLSGGNIRERPSVSILYLFPW